MELHMLWFPLVSFLNHKDGTSITNQHIHPDLHQTEQPTPRAKSAKMQTKWQRQLINWMKPIHIFSFRTTEINVCLTRVPSNRWEPSRGLLTNGMLTAPTRAALLQSSTCCAPRSAFTYWLLCSVWSGSWACLCIPGEVKYEKHKSTWALQGADGQRELPTAPASLSHIPMFYTNTIHWHRRWSPQWGQEGGQVHGPQTDYLRLINIRQHKERKCKVKIIIHGSRPRRQAGTSEQGLSSDSENLCSNPESVWAGVSQPWCHVTWHEQHLTPRAMWGRMKCMGSHAQLAANKYLSLVLFDFFLKKVFLEEWGRRI